MSLQTAKGDRVPLSPFALACAAECLGTAAAQTLDKCHRPHDRRGQEEEPDERTKRRQASSWNEDAHEQVEKRRKQGCYRGNNVGHCWCSQAPPFAKTTPMGPELGIEPRLPLDYSGVLPLALLRGISAGVSFT